MKRRDVLLLVIGLFFVLIILFCFNVGASIYDFTGKSIFTGMATTQNTNVSIFISGAPEITGINSLILACESSSLSYLFNASDDVGNILTFSITNPGIFFVRNLSSNSNSSKINYIAEIYSVVLTKNHAGNNYSRTISVSDGGSTDSKSTNISVIEINNALVMTTIGDKSVSLNNGGNFYYKVNVSDTEDGDQDSGNFSFNISFISGSAVFGINSSTGIINKTFTSSEIGNYSVRVCATDLGIPVSQRHVNISYCGQGDGSNRSDCESFNVEVSQQTPQSQSLSSGGSSGSGGGGISCEEKWGCESWSECKNLLRDLGTGDLSGEDYRSIGSYCSSNSLSEEKCGYQRRTCIEINTCKTEKNKPSELQACYYTENPSCIDGIKNCHDGDCEFLVDCGGPCEMCATCSDGIQNQFEEGIDCGGPCPSSCIFFSSPSKDLDFEIGDDLLKVMFGAILVVLFIVLAIKLSNINKLRKS